MFIFFSNRMDTTESCMGVLGEIDVWDGLDDVDLEQSRSYNALDNEHRAHECSEAFSTNEVWSMSVSYTHLTLPTNREV